MSKAGTIQDPTSRKEALNSPESAEWQLAETVEMGALAANETWCVERLPAGAKPIPTKFVYKSKRGPSGEIERYKARLVVQGCRQEEGLDFIKGEISAPVSNRSVVRVMLALAAALDVELHSMDVTSAFLHGELEETVYVQGPPGYETKPGYGYRLLKPLYGLKQAPRCWYTKLSSRLAEMGFFPSAADPALFVCERGGGIYDYLSTWVDDLVIATKSKARMAEIKEQLARAFEARDLGELTFYLGMSVERDRAAGTIKLSQPRAISDLLADYGLQECRGQSLPLKSGVKLSGSSGDPLDTGTCRYSALVGSLLYLSVCTRPDISFVVGALTRYMQKPTTVHWDAALGVLRYLATTKNDGLLYGRQPGELQGYCDADFAGDLDTRRSTTGYVFILNGGAVSWQSKRQQTVAASTTEAEYQAAAAAVREALWLRKLLGSMGLGVEKINICADNTACIHMLNNPVLSSRSKHIDVIHHFARERVQRGEVAFRQVDTSQMVADALTKAVPAETHAYCRRAMGVM